MQRHIHNSSLTRRTCNRQQRNPIRLRRASSHPRHATLRPTAHTPQGGPPRDRHPTPLPAARRRPVPPCIYPLPRTPVTCAMQPRPAPFRPRMGQRCISRRRVTRDETQPRAGSAAARRAATRLHALYGQCARAPHARVAPPRRVRGDRAGGASAASRRDGARASRVARARANGARGAARAAPVPRLGAVAPAAGR